jgi:hypothetical protein
MLCDPEGLSYDEPGRKQTDQALAQVLRTGAQLWGSDMAVAAWLHCMPDMQIDV